LALVSLPVPATLMTAFGLQMLRVQEAIQEAQISAAIESLEDVTVLQE